MLKTHQKHYSNLFAHIQRHVNIKEEELDDICSYFHIENYRKKETVLSAGSIARRNFFVVQGCLHMSFINKKGVSQTIQFAIENWWMTDLTSYLFNTESQFSIQAVENTQVLSISSEREEELYQEHPKMERYFRKIYQIAYAAFLCRTKYSFELSKEEMYWQFVESFPEFAQRVPQYLIASYLGLSPEYVSEIRSRKRY
ncbi:MAG: cyclic nucleotide-binding protein [Flammeovirgaceae bacterium]|nr:cyclic nucleotide-binding protein [Flammeovirgaceae bacterium]|tara:strand:- start:1213 stop:1809 length:597 start_codon:yes stop_codon:yes gene_type:complete